MRFRGHPVMSLRVVCLFVKLSSSVNSSAPHAACGGPDGTFWERAESAEFVSSLLNPLLLVSGTEQRVLIVWVYNYV